MSGYGARMFQEWLPRRNGRGKDQSLAHKIGLSERQAAVGGKGGGLRRQNGVESQWLGRYDTPVL